MNYGLIVVLAGCGFIVLLGTSFRVPRIRGFRREADGAITVYPRYWSSLAVGAAGVPICLVFLVGGILVQLLPVDEHFTRPDTMTFV
jgi:hypothetical protein